MVMGKRAVEELARSHFDSWQRSTNLAKDLNLWLRSQNPDPQLPNNRDKLEYDALVQMSKSPWARLIVGSVAQGLAVTDHRDEVSAESTHTFKEVWKPNGLMARQQAVYRGALGQNLSYVTTLPGRRPHTGAPTVRIRGVPATEMAAFYDEEGEDDFARFAIRGVVQAPEGSEPYLMFHVLDDEAHYVLSCETNGSEMAYISHQRHDVGVTPVHRFAPHLDLEGIAQGEIEPFLTNLRRLDQDTFDRLVVQRFASWRVRYATGLVRPETDAEQRAAEARMRAEDLLVSANKDTRFGTLEASDVGQYVDAREADIRELAAVSQTPPHFLLGQMANLSAEALAAAMTALVSKVQEYQISFAQSWDQVLRSSAFIMSQRAGSQELRDAYLQEALDYSTEIKWKDPEHRSLAQVADALGKIAEQLEVPVEMLWEKLPFWSTEDTTRAEELRQLGTDEEIMRFLDEELTRAGSGDRDVQEPAGV